MSAETTAPAPIVRYGLEYYPNMLVSNGVSVEFRAAKHVISEFCRDQVPKSVVFTFVMSVEHDGKQHYEVPGLEIYFRINSALAEDDTDRIAQDIASRLNQRIVAAFGLNDALVRPELQRRS